ncbi:MAG: aminoglycoside phosphotransferase (APT) family kinase protein [Limisphaerales bacterium]|jgi:aminoglycoside phosphotransferase (APT) family kinase protein
MPDESSRIDVPLVERLISTQFPQWAHLPISPVELSGWDNRTFHLGSEMTVRMPSGKHYASAVEREQKWLPIFAPKLPLPISTPLAMGKPNDEYPWQWSVYRWLQGDVATYERIDDLDQFAADLAGFLRQMQQMDTSGGPSQKLRGGSLEIYNAQARAAIEVLRGEIDWRLATEIWEKALRARFTASPVWFHGDVAAGNLLVRHGKLEAVIDFGGMGVGDPACDTTIAWTFLTATTRQAFRETLRVDDAIWARGRGWALWKGMIVMAKLIDTNAIEKASSAYTVSQVLEDYRAAS